MLRCITESQILLYAPNCKEEETRQLSRSGLLFCPSCKDKVQFCRGQKKGSYFRHPKSNCIAYKYDYSESPNHKKGKDILYNWLKNKFEKAIVEKEKYIPETGQIADILVTHTEGKLKGCIWAFEYQHSKLPKKDWDARHNLYQNANIVDFWILDAEVFLKYSQSNDERIKNARNKQDLQETIYSTTGFCYFLNISTLDLTIDFKFREEFIGPKNPKDVFYPSKPYKFHSPLKHSCRLEEIQFMYYEGSSDFIAMFYKDIAEKLKKEFKTKSQAFKIKKQKKWDKELESKIQQILEYTKINYDEVFFSCMKRFIEINKQDIQIDAYHLPEEEFLQKYEAFVRVLQKYETERLVWKESVNDTLRIIYELSVREKDEEGICSLEFLDKNKLTLKDHYLEKYKNKIEIITYVLRNYEEPLKKLAQLNPNRIRTWLSKINTWLTPLGIVNPTKFDYAFAYRHIKSKEEVDKIFKVIQEETNILK
ncbi:competence protein CoiA [Bacillus sp. Brlt_9]|uniref:competence protein CoiA n=1 Tax=Bacillus sp. Brlt_9 TaxID=3110916 RepID=UPI003F7BB2AA